VGEDRHDHRSGTEHVDVEDLACLRERGLFQRANDAISAMVNDDVEPPAFVINGIDERDNCLGIL
jgi:hypothetical protein